MNQSIKQHLIDPEICIRCHTCEEACPIDAITHNDDNVVVDASICNHCMSCIAPCPTGSIDNWRVVLEPYSLDEQFEWMELPEQEDIEGPASGGEGSLEALDDSIAALIAEAHAGAGGTVIAPASAAKPTVNLFSPSQPATAVVQGNYRLTESDDHDVRHIILDLGDTVFPVLEGQSIGVTPPGETVPRLYSISSARDGERPNTNNLSLTVKREPGGKASTYLCDLSKGDEIAISGPFGNSFLMPDDPSTKILAICTGTGSAPFRAMTMRRQRTGAHGGMQMFFGARTPQELPYFGPLKKVPAKVLQQHLVFSRLDSAPKEYVQDRMLTQADTLVPLLNDPTTHIYVCGLKGMEAGVDQSLEKIASDAGLDWTSLRETLRADGRYHVETY